jgi:hypothetical protein
MSSQDGAVAMSTRDHALRVALAAALGEIAAKAEKKARAGGAPAFAAHRIDGSDNTKVLLPDGTQVGLLLVRAGATEAMFAEGDLLAWVQANSPDDAEDYVDPAAWGNADIVELVRAVFPEVVKTRVRDSARKKLVKEMTDSGGWLADRKSGEIKGTQIAAVTEHDPTGAVTYRPGPGAAEKIAAEWMAGRLDGIDPAGLLALPAADGEP